MKFRLIDYFDVWGNEEGYDVNNWCEQGIFECDEWPTEIEILRKLKAMNYLKKKVRRNSIHFDYSASEMVVIEEKNGRPICCIELMDHEIERFGPEGYDNYHLENGRKVYDEKEKRHMTQDDYNLMRFNLKAWGLRMKWWRNRFSKCDKSAYKMYTKMVIWWRNEYLKDLFYIDGE